MQPSPSPDQVLQQNRLYYARQRLLTRDLLPRTYTNQHLPELVSKYEGYMQIYRRKQQGEAAEYYSSSFLSELREKRNSTFSDEIIEKMVKQYDLREYASQVDWRPIAANGLDLTRTRFANPASLEIENYRQITNRMLEK